MIKLNKGWMHRLINILIGKTEWSTQEYLNIILHDNRLYGPETPITQEVFIALEEVLDET